MQDLQVAQTKTYSSEQWVTYLNHYIPLIHQDIHINIQRSQIQQQKQFNKNRKQKESFFVGDQVLKIKMKESWKFSEPKFSGPWKIIGIKNKDGSAFF